MKIFRGSPRPTPQGAAAQQRAGQTETARSGWPASFFRTLDKAVSEMLAEYPHLDARAALRAVLEDDPNMAEGYRNAMRWTGGGENYDDRGERIEKFSECVAAMSPKLRHLLQGDRR